MTNNNCFVVIDKKNGQKFEIEKASDFGRIIQQELQKIISMKEFKTKFLLHQKADNENFDFILD